MPKKLDRFHLGQRVGIVDGLNHNFAQTRANSQMQDDTTLGGDTPVGSTTSALGEDTDTDESQKELQALWFEDNLDGTITIFDGFVEHGTKIFFILEATVSLNAGVNFIYVEYLWDQDAFIADAISIRPISTDDNFRKVLFRFMFNSDTQETTLEKIEWNGGNIHIPAAFGPESF